MTLEEAEEVSRTIKREAEALNARIRMARSSGLVVELSTVRLLETAGQPPGDLILVEVFKRV